MSPLHWLKLEYKRESKQRARVKKASRDLELAAKTRIGDEGKINIDYF